MSISQWFSNTWEFTEFTFWHWLLNQIFNQTINAISENMLYWSILLFYHSSSLLLIIFVNEQFLSNVCVLLNIKFKIWKAYFYGYFRRYFSGITHLVFMSCLNDFFFMRACSSAVAFSTRCLNKFCDALIALCLTYCFSRWKGFPKPKPS